MCQKVVGWFLQWNHKVCSLRTLSNLLSLGFPAFCKTVPEHKYLMGLLAATVSLPLFTDAIQCSNRETIDLIRKQHLILTGSHLV